MIAHDGTHVWPTHGAPTLREIAIGLGRAPRFAGQTRHYYNVLAHSLAVASITPLEHRHYALLHDAHEAILGDMVTTWKQDDPERNMLENRLQNRIHDSLGLSPPNALARAAIKEADLACLAAEAHILGHALAETYWPIADVSIDAHMATVAQLRECQGYLEPERSARVLTTAYKRVLSDQGADPRSSMAETFLEAAASARGER